MAQTYFTGRPQEHRQQPLSQQVQKVYYSYLGKCECVDCRPHTHRTYISARLKVCEIVTDFALWAYISARDRTQTPAHAH